MTVSNIMVELRKTGISPFNPDIVIVQPPALELAVKKDFQKSNTQGEKGQQINLSYVSKEGDRFR